MIPTLRILTRKSKLGFGKYKDLTVQFVLENRKKYNLINPYYGLTSISYTEDILNELGITEEYRIQKPGRDAEMWRKFKTDKNMFPSLYLKPYTGSEALRKSTKPFSKGYLQNKNHGR